MSDIWNVGDLVFVRISGYPWWPGQVMATDKVGQKFMALRKDGTAPVNFFGDNEFGWCLSEDMLSFDKHYKELSKQNMTRQYRNFRKAVEEAKEVADRRAGKTPVTSHDPVDFLDPSTYPQSDSEDAHPHKPDKDLRPLPLEAEAAKETTAQHALQLLYKAARELGQTPEQVASSNAGALRQLLFSYIRRRLVVAQGLSSPPEKAAKERPAKRKSLSEKTPQKKKQRLVKAGSAGSTEKEGKRRLSIKKESSELEDVEEEALPQSQPSVRKPQQPPRQELEAQAADSDEDDSTPVITGAEEIKYRPQKLQAFLLKARACAADEGHRRLLARNATEFAACLRLREQVYARSRHHLSKREEWGVCLKEALSMPGMQFERPPKPRKARRKSGIHVPVPEPHETATFYEYGAMVSMDRQTFMGELEAFYARNDALLHTPQVDGGVVDLHKVFLAVAERGGCEAVMLNRQWREVCLACHPDTSNKQLPGLIRKHYCRLLLAFERELTQGVPSHTISKKPRAEKEGKAKSAHAEVAVQASKAAAKRPAPQVQEIEVSEGSSASEAVEEDAESAEEDSEDEPYEEAFVNKGHRAKPKPAKQQKPKLRQVDSPKESLASNKVLQKAAKQKRKPENGHDAFADLDDEPIPQPKKPKEATDFDVVGEVLNNLRPPGPPLKQLKMKFDQVFELPSQSIVWAIMKDITKDWEMKKEAILLNHLTKSVVVTFRTERHAKAVYDFLMKKKIIFKAPKAAVELSLHAPGDNKSKPGKRQQHATSFRSKGRPAPVYAAPSAPVVPYQDPRRPPAAPQHTSLFRSLAAESRTSQPTNVTPIGDPRLLYGRPAQPPQMGAAAQQPQQQQQQYSTYNSAAPAPASAQGYAQPVDPRRAAPSDPRLSSAPGLASGSMHQPQASSAPAGAQLGGLDLMAILQNAGVRPIPQPQAHPGVKQEPPSSMQAPMLAGEMENMYAAPISNGQWAGSQGGPSVPQLQLKTEQAAPTQDSAQGGQTGTQDSSAANMSDQMLQILEQLKRGG